VTSILIRSKNEEAYIGEVLSMIFEQCIDSEFEVVVLDSGSTDRTLEIARKFNVNIHEMAPEVFTFGYSLNKGISLTSGEIVCCLSAHCVPINNNWLHELVEPILSGKADATIGRQIPIKGLNPFEELAVASYFPAIRQDGRSPHLSNANCAFSRGLWEETKFDEKILGWEDYLWYLQVRSRYSVLYCPRAAVHHSHPFSFKYTIKRSYGDGKAVRYIREVTDVDLTDGKADSKWDIIKHIYSDLKRNARFLLREGYYRHLLFLPVIKPLVYLAYQKGLREKL
jgi:rhamnosyltransferase